MRIAPSLVRLVAPNHFDRRSLVYVWATDSLASRFAADYMGEPGADYASSSQARATASR